MLEEIKHDARQHRDVNKRRMYEENAETAISELINF